MAAPSSDSESDHGSESSSDIVVVLVPPEKSKREIRHTVLAAWPSERLALGSAKRGVDRSKGTEHVPSESNTTRKVPGIDHRSHLKGNDELEYPDEQLPYGEWSHVDLNSDADAPPE